MSDYTPRETVKEVMEYPFLDFPQRGIRKETMETFGVRCGVSQTDGKTIEAVYFPSYNQKGVITGYKKQDLTKDKSEKYHWSTIGSVLISNKLFGQQVAEQVQRKRGNLTYTEGEWDWMSCYQAMRDSVRGHKTYSDLIPFGVSIPMGTANAVEATMHNLDFVTSFESLTIFFDNDCATPKEKEKGIMKGFEAREAVANCLIGSNLSLFVLGAKDSHKDASDMLQAGLSDVLAKMVQFDKRPFSAEKIVKASDISLEEILAPRVEGLYIPEFPKLMDKIHGFRKRELVLLTSPSGVGKCHGKDTPILMADLSKKLVQDVVVGDFVMGADGQPRKVLNLSSGVDELYEVQQVKGASYTVNSQHILSLKSNSDAKERGIKKGEVLNICVTDFINLPSHYKTAVLKGYKADLVKLGDTALDKDDVYILGLWLADGTSSKPQFTVARKDIELHEELSKYVEKRGYGVNTSPSNNRENCIAYDWRGGYLKELKDLGVLNNKHIPKTHLLSDYETRLELLAGFLDGDGHKVSNGFEMTLKDDQLAEDIILLARSVGLSVQVKDKFCKCQNFEGAIYKRIHVFGNTDKIPNRLARKKCLPRKQIKDALRTGITVTAIGKGEYYGFEVDGDHLYCLGDFTVTHNSTVVSKFSSGIMSQGERVGMIYLEETNKETMQRMIAAELKVNFNKFKNNPLSVASHADIAAARQKIVDNDQLVMLGHFGSLPITELMNKIKHMHLVEKCGFIFIDHLSVVISGTDIVNERKELDMVMTELAAFCAANDVGIIAISHIKRLESTDLKPPKGKEEEPFWVRVTKEMMRGSAALEQLSWVVLGLEPEIRPDRQRGRVRLTCLKNRPWSYLGEADTFKMDEETWEVILSVDDVDF